MRRIRVATPRVIPIRLCNCSANFTHMLTPAIGTRRSGFLPSQPDTTNCCCATRLRRARRKKRGRRCCGIKKKITDLKVGHYTTKSNDASVKGAADCFTRSRFLASLGMTNYADYSEFANRAPAVSLWGWIVVAQAWWQTV